MSLKLLILIRTDRRYAEIRHTSEFLKTFEKGETQIRFIVEFIK